MQTFSNSVHTTLFQSRVALQGESSIMRGLNCQKQNGVKIINLSLLSLYKGMLFKVIFFEIRELIIFLIENWKCSLTFLQTDGPGCTRSWRGTPCGLVGSGSWPFPPHWSLQAWYVCLLSALVLDVSSSFYIFQALFLPGYWNHVWNVVKLDHFWDLFY